MWSYGLGSIIGIGTWRYAILELIEHKLNTNFYQKSLTQVIVRPTSRRGRSTRSKIGKAKAKSEASKPKPKWIG